MPDRSIHRWIKFLCVIVLCLSLNGCALFSLPGQIVGGTFGLLGQAFQLAQSMPKPPPWMFF